ncbi:hypothetical protein YC2023_061031 [Brassica napus]
MEGSLCRQFSFSRGKGEVPGTGPGELHSGEPGFLLAGTQRPVSCLGSGGIQYLSIFPQQAEDEHEMRARTIYYTNIDTKLTLMSLHVTQTDIKLFFEAACGEVYRLRLLGDYHHPTRISFVEFVMAESAVTTLNCSGVLLGSLQIRVSPSNTPVCSRAISALPDM